MRVRILQPAKSAMQSGRAKAQHWTIKPETPTARVPEPLMGWVSAGDTLGELNGVLNFDTQEEAVAFAKKNNWDYVVVLPKQRKVTPRNYMDNFKWVRPQDQVADQAAGTSRK